MNIIAEQALRGLKSDVFPSTRGMCQKFARISVQSAIGHGYDGVLQKASAKEAALSLRAAGLARDYVQGQILQPGDLLYKTIGSGGFGHVGVYVGNNQVAENSSYHVRNGGSDARGIRTLEQFGAFQIVARFPAKEATPDAPVKTIAEKTVTVKARACRVFVGGEPIVNALILNGKAHFGAEHLRALGAAIEYDKAADIIRITRKAAA